MTIKRHLPRASVLLFLTAALFALAACQSDEQLDRPESTEEVEVQAAMQPSSSPTTPEAWTEEPTGEAAPAADAAPSEVPAGAATEPEEYNSMKELFSAKVPAGWSTQEFVSGAGFVMANSEEALERHSSGDAIRTGDFVLNIGFLPLTLLQEKQLAHLGFEFDASPEVFFQSLLPMFRIGDVPAESVAGEPVLVSVGDGRDAGLVTISNDGRQGLILIFASGDNVIAFVSAESYPGEIDAFEEITYAIAAEVVFRGTPDALYGALYGG